jgi:hypothetical protein
MNSPPDTAWTITVTSGTPPVPVATVFVLPEPRGIVVAKIGVAPLTLLPNKRESFAGYSYEVAGDDSNFTVFFSDITSSVIPLFPKGPEGTTPLLSSPSAPATSVLEIVSTASNSDTRLPLQTASASSTPASPSASASGSIPSPESSNLKGGAVAGVAIGCLIAGGLITGLLVWFLWGRRKAASARHHESSAVTLINREKGANAQVTSVASGSPIPKAMENGLPQPLEDQAISGEVSKISNAIKNHVQSFYHSGKVSPGLLDLDDLQGLGNNLPMSTGTLSTLLGNSDTREIALRFCIAWVAVSRMQLEALPSMTFLPPEVTECFLSMTPEDRGPRGRMSQSINMSLTNHTIAHALYMSKWRVITAELLQSVYVRNPFSAVDPRSQNIKAAINVLEGILQPYADSRVDNTQRRRNLEEILKRSALFAFTLFSQPSSWKFDWQDEEVFKSGSLCVFPALVQVTDDNGDSVKPPRPFSEAVIRRLDE